ncbi:MAG: hypothetical protein GVY17_10500 [Cyanobacteria bacterium]|jgi:hypothetical protein|nr:hypothetical protein [Cyanobacteria bacterium GSL.Bin21]
MIGQTLLYKSSMMNTKSKLEQLISKIEQYSVKKLKLSLIFKWFRCYLEKIIFVAYDHEPQILIKLFSLDKISYQVYDPASNSLFQFKSEEEIRYWLDERHYLPSWRTDQQVGPEKIKYIYFWVLYRK